jgi:hypothetical protein
MSAQNLDSRQRQTHILNASVCARLVSSCFSINSTKVASACTPLSELADTIILAESLDKCWIYWWSGFTSQKEERSLPDLPHVPSRDHAVRLVAELIR